MKEPSGLLGKSYLTSCEMRKVVMQTAEPVSTREVIEILVKIFDSTYVNADLKHVAYNTYHLNAEEITQLIRPIVDFRDLFDVTLGDWDIDHVDL